MKVPSATTALLVACLSLPGSCAAQVMQDYDYQPDRIYEVRSGVGITTQVALDPGDEIKDYSTGFSSGWELSRRDNVFYLKPRNIDVDTNMTIRTARRTYYLELKVVATHWKSLGDAKRAGVHYRVGFRYPKDASAVAETPVAVTASTRAPLHFAYSKASSGTALWLVPAAIHDDGTFTYLRMQAAADATRREFPAVFARNNEDGEDFVVNSHVEQDTIVVHGVHPYLVLRHGTDVVGVRRDPGP